LAFCPGGGRGGTMSTVVADKARALFQRIDTNHSGRINVDEMRKALQGDPTVKQELAWPGTGEELVALLASGGRGSFQEKALVHYCEVRYLFNLIDINRSGRISTWELETSLRRSQQVREKLGVPPELSNTLFEQIDTNSSGAISLVEFFRHYTAAPLSRPYKPIGDHAAICDRLFRKIDRDGSGGISKQEFVSAIKDDPEIQLELGQPAHRSEQVFNFLDEDQNGELSETEFRNFCRAQWLFNGIDINRSGFVDPYELGAALEDPLLQRELRCPLDQAQALFKKIDTRKAGVLRFSDFHRWLTKQPQPDQQPAAPGPKPPAVPRQKAPKAQGEAAYKVEKMLAEGAFGKVYLVTRKTDKLELILKEPKPEAGATMEEVEAEATMLARLKHQNIVRFVDSYVKKGDRPGDEKLFIVTEFCAGGDLRKHQKQKALQEDSAKKIFSDILTGMVYLHDRGILHRDLKPDNILLTDTLIAKISDFGLAKQAQNKAAPGGAIAQTYCGTPFYMGPELHEGKEYGKANDIWALGCILYEMATGEFCFTNVADIVRHKVPAKLATIWCSREVTQMIQQEEARRPSVKAVLAAFDKSAPRRLGYSGHR